MARLDKVLAHCQQEKGKVQGKYVLGAGSMLYRFGVTQDEYLRLLEIQGGGCAICGVQQERLCVDHDHVSGRVRGLLCGKCNRGIGLLGDSVSAMHSASEYLKSPPASCLSTHWDEWSGPVWC